MSNIHRLRITDRIFFLTVQLRRRAEPFHDSQYGILVDVLPVGKGLVSRPEVMTWWIYR
jgi:hypothetical protein